jgi:hypothetical protein
MDMSFIDSQPFGVRDPGEGLRAFGWSELCARLLAAQAARQVLGQKNGADIPGSDGLSGGSFHYPSAIMMLQAYSRDESCVNPNHSVNGNGDCCKDAELEKAPGDVTDRVLTRRELP